MSTLPAPLEALRVGLNEAADAAAAREKENVRLLEQVSELTLENADLMSRIAAAKTDGAT